MLVFFAEYGCQSARDGGIIRNNIAADPSEQGGARPDEKREAVEQLHEEGRTREDDRQRDGQADHEQGEVASRDTGEGDDVVEAEDDVCREHDSHDRRQIGCGRNGFLARAALHQEFDRDVDEREAPDQLDVRIGQQRRDDDREGEEQQRRGAGANGDAPRSHISALRSRKVAN